MSDPQVEQRAKELLRPHALRARNREMYSSVDYVDAVAVVSDLLTKLDEAKDEKRRTDKFLRMERVAARKNLGPFYA